ncbi:hypothetical protein ABZ614_26220 [Streptomyces sp. NPDC013178]|uniref:hypothetical protein n=1 Tax=Streptomyces sp. NPDC013178 TaxID=3155118 RepID=UPI0033E6AB9C
MTGMGMEAGAQAARARALGVLRIRNRALAVALLPAAAAVILLAGGSTEHLMGSGWDVARWTVSALAFLVLLAAGVVALVVARARPAVSPTVAIAESAAPDLYRMVRDLADRLDVPAPSAIALTPDCDSWLEDRTHPAHGPPAPRDGDEIAGPGPAHRHPHRRSHAAPVLVIGSPFLWWMRVGELRAVLAPVVAGTGPSAHPDIAAARRFVRGLDAAVAVSADRGRCPGVRLVCAGIGWVARLLLRGCQVHATEMERGVAAAAAERAQAVDYGLRIVAQEQVGLAYAGWDRLLTRVALPAWRMGRWPSRLDAGVVAALTELSRRDRLAEGFASRLGERPACDLLEEPGAVDEAASLLAARLFHGGPPEPGPGWSPVDWREYPDEVVDRKWRTDAARLHRVLDALGVRRAPDPATQAPDGPTLARVLDHLTGAAGTPCTAPTWAEHLHSAALLPEAALDPSAPGEAPDAATSKASEALDVPATAEASKSPATMDAPAATDAREVPESLDDPEAVGATEALGARASLDSPEAQDARNAQATGQAPHPLEAPRDVDTAQAPDGLEAQDSRNAQATGQAPNTLEAPRDVDTAASDAPAPPSPAETPKFPESPIASPAPTAPAPTTTEPPTAAQPPPAQPPPAPSAPTAPPVEDLAPSAHEAEDTGAADLAPNPRSAALAARLGAELAREESEAVPSTPVGPATPGQGLDAGALWDGGALPLFPLQPPRTDRELLTDHVTAMVCCAAMDTVGATPGLDWLDGPTLLVDGVRVTDLTPRVLSLVEDGDAAPLRSWLVELGIRPEKPVRLG